MKSSPNRNYVNTIFGNSSYIKVYKKILHFWGKDTAFLIEHLVEKQEYYTTLKKLDKSGYFYLISSNIWKDISLSKYEQNKSISLLEKLGILSTKLITTKITTKKFFRIDNDMLKRQFDYIASKEISKEEINAYKKLIPPPIKNLYPPPKKLSAIKTQLIKLSKDNYKESSSNLLSSSSLDCKELSSKDSLLQDEFKKRLQEQKKAETIKKKAGTIKLKGFPLRVVKIWNKYKPLTSVIRLNNPSKTQTEINDSISALRNGEYYNLCTLSKSWREKNNIADSLLRKKFKKKEIIKVVKDMVKFNKKGYWPETKTNFHKNLNNLFFHLNRKTNERSSCFFLTYLRPPGTLKTKDTNPKLTKMILEAFPDSVREDEKEKLYKKISSLVFFWENRLNDRKLDTDTFKSPESMLRAYLAYLEKEDWSLEIIKKGGIVNLIGSKDTLYRFVYALEATWPEGKGYLTGKYIKPPEPSKKEQRQIEKAEREKEEKEERQRIRDIAMEEGYWTPDEDEDE